MREIWRARRTVVVAQGANGARLLRRLRRCQSIAGPVGALAELAGAVAAGKIAIAPLDSVIPYTGASLGELTERERDLFWKVFQAPVFEQWRGADNELLAEECAAHDGLHVVAGEVHAELDFTVCACGNPAPRVRAYRDAAAMHQGRAAAGRAANS